MFVVPHGKNISFFFDTKIDVVTLVALFRAGFWLAIG
jgi:hypothetical protein